MAVNYFESGNRYTDPVRYFKANDPYYFEVDNIPIKQLEENSKWLKDQVDGLVRSKASTTLSRDTFTELRPYVNTTDSTVKVNPGRFTARINDAYTIDPLQFITQALGIGNNAANLATTWDFQTATGSDVAAVLAKWQEQTAENATLMNGLFERTFVYPMQDNDMPGQGLLDAQSPEILSEVATRKAAWPGFEGLTHVNDTSYLKVEKGVADLRFLFPDVFRYTGQVESEFIKRWRGVARTAIVDVPDELSIEIPKFDADDFFYHDVNGEKRSATSTQRIDLLFIYSKAIDQSETTLASYSDTTPRRITKAALGIVKGAGLGIKATIGTTTSNEQPIINLQSLDGTTLMIPNSSDNVAANTGFSTSAGTVRGSFPSPDDLMNLAPLLSENLRTDSFALIGQSILPVAYIIVKEGAQINANGTSIITPDDLIDIRPFFRTTELAYNERSGIAAATPQISIANPVVSEGYVDLIKKDLVQDYTSKIENAAGMGEGARVVAAGTIKGGMYYGVEGALASYVRQQYNANTYNQARQIVEERYGYQANTIPALPDWDISRWCQQGNFTQKGQKPNDRINYHHFGLNGAAYTTTPLEFGPFKNTPSLVNGVPSFDPVANPRVDRLGTDDGNFFSFDVTDLPDGSHGLTSQLFVSKRVLVDRSQIPWAADYYVVAQFSNCVPTTCKVGNSRLANLFTDPAATAGIWVDKRDNEFTIFVSWAGMDPIVEDTNTNYSDGLIVPRNRDDGGKYAGFTVMNSDIMQATNPNGGATGTGTDSVTAGVAIYPSVTFQIVGVPQNISTQSRTILNQSNPTLTLL